MSQEFENFSFVSKFNLDAQMLQARGDDTKNKTESPTTKYSNSPYRPKKHRNIHTVNYHPNSPTNEIKGRQLYSLGIEVLPKLDNRHTNTPQAGALGRSRDLSHETFITFGDESGMESLATDRQQLASETNRNNGLGISYRIVKYQTNPTNPETNESPRRAPQSARVRYQRPESSTSIQTKEQIQIQQFKNLLQQHPEPRPQPQRPSSHRKLRPKSQQQPMINSFTNDSKLNYDWRPVLGKKGTLQFQDNSLEKTSASGFLSDRKSTLSKPEQDVLPTKPMLHRKRNSQNREQSPVNANNVSSNLQAQVTIIPPKRALLEKSLNRSGKRIHLKNLFSAVSDRSKSHDINPKGLHFDHFQNREISPRPVTNGVDYIFTRKSNLPISQETRKLVRAIEPVSQQERIARETNANQTPSNFQFIDFLLRNTQTKQLHQNTLINESKETPEAKASNKTYFKANFRSRGGQRSNFKQTFGVLDSSEADFASLKNKNAHHNPAKENEHIKPQEHKTPKFKAVNHSIFQNGRISSQNSSSQQLEHEVLTDRTENRNSEDKLPYKYPSPYSRGKILVTARTQPNSVAKKPPK